MNHTNYLIDPGITTHSAKSEDGEDSTKTMGSHVYTPTPIMTRGRVNYPYNKMKSELYITHKYVD